MIKALKAGLLSVKVYEERVAMGEAAAKEVETRIGQLLEMKQELSIVFAAAPSQNEFLAALRKADIDWSKINAFHMDEYLGLAVDAPQAFGNFLRRHLFDTVPFKTIHYMNGQAEDAEMECNRYTQLLTAHPIDMVCFGIGENGHLAFNDPPVADFKDGQGVKVVALDETCRQQQVNDGCFVQLDDVPKRAITLTIPALFHADYLYGVVPGINKAQAVANTLNGPITEACPASILRTHAQAVLFLDRASSVQI